jgi:outer membrane protein TolC
LEIRQAHTRLQQAQQGLRLWSEQVVPQTEAAMESARKALEEDRASLLLVLETTRQVLTAQQNELEATAEVRLALADLERSVGLSLIHE